MGYIYTGSEDYYIVDRGLTTVLQPNDYIPASEISYMLENHPDLIQQTEGGPTAGDWVEPSSGWGSVGPTGPTGPDGSGTGSSGNFGSDLPALAYVINIPLEQQSYYSRATFYNGFVYFYGGISNMATLPQFRKYDPAINTWTNLPDGDFSCVFGKIVICGINKLCLVGAISGSMELDHYIRIYNFQGETWTESSDPCPTTRGQNLGCTASYNGKVYLWGGTDENFEALLDVVDIYDPETDTWSSGTPGGTKTCDAASVVAGNKWYIFGGDDYDDYSSISAVSIYNFDTDTWSSGTSGGDAGGVGRYLATGVTYGDKVYLIGGFDCTEDSNDLYSIDIYDIIEDNWLPLVELDSTFDDSCGQRAFDGSTLYIFSGSLTETLADLNRLCFDEEAYIKAQDAYTLSVITGPGLVSFEGISTTGQIQITYADNREDDIENDDIEIVLPYFETAGNWVFGTGWSITETEGLYCATYSGMGGPTYRLSQTISGLEIGKYYRVDVSIFDINSDLSFWAVLGDIPLSIEGDYTPYFIIPPTKLDHSFTLKYLEGTPELKFYFTSGSLSSIKISSINISPEVVPSISPFSLQASADGIMTGGIEVRAYSDSLWTIGYNSGVFISGGSQTVAFAIGSSCFRDYQGNGNIAIGHEAMLYCIGDNNTAVGMNALGQVGGGSNVGIGNLTLGLVSTHGNIAVGYSAGCCYAGDTDENEGEGNNTFIGYSCAGGSVSGYNNTFIGAYSGCINNGHGNIFIGYNAGCSETGSDKLNIDNSDTSDPLIGGDFSERTLTFNADVEITGSVAVGSNVAGSGTFSINGTEIAHNLGTTAHVIMITAVGSGDFDPELVSALGTVYVKKGANSDWVYKTGDSDSDTLGFDYIIMRISS
jgi:hypothetical protein